METVLIKACGFLFMIALGFVLKRIGLFSLEDKLLASGGRKDYAGFPCTFFVGMVQYHVENNSKESCFL